MTITYGVLRGRPDRYKREDNASTPHLQIRVLESSGQPWRIAVNVESDTGSDVAFWVVDPLVGPLDLTIGPGQSVLVTLDGKGVQLGNQGGTLTLQDDHGAQVDVVTDTGTDATPEDRDIRFRR